MAENAAQGEWTLPDSWMWMSFGDFIESLKNGIYKPASFYGSGVPCLRMYNIEDGKIVWKDIKLMRLSDAECEQYGLVPGDILINRVNSRELVGKAAVVPLGLGSLVYESKNIRMRLVPKSVLPQYCAYFLLTRSARDQIESQAKQTVGMATISQSQIVSRIVAEVERRLSVVTALETEVEAALARAARLRQSILKRAFEGRLVAQDPNDEPASALMARIKVEREAGKGKCRQKGKQPQQLELFE